MRNQILQGDVLEMLETLSAESINCIITSPPYFGLRDYGLPPTHWPAVSYAPMAGLPEITIPPMVCCFGLEDTIEAYVGHMVLVWRELWRALRGDGVGWLNLGDSYAANGLPGLRRSGDHKRDCQCSGCTMPNLPKKVPNGLKPKDLIGIPWRCAFALQADGWYLRSDVIWAKCLSGGTVIYAQTQNAEGPMAIKDLVRLDPSTVKLWTGEKWSQVVGWNETPPNPDRKLDSQKRRTHKSKTGETLPPAGELEIHLRSGEKIGCTQYHKFPTQRGLLEAKELKPGDILQSCLLPEPEYPIDPRHLPDTIGWLIGLYLAEGCKISGGNTLQISGHINEVERWARLEKLANDYGDHFRFYPTKNGNGANAHIDGKMLLTIIDTYINGKLAKGKHLAPVCWKRSNGFLSQVLQGYLDGDGHFNASNNRWRLGFTKNDALAQDLRTLAGRLGFSLRLKRTKHTMNGRKFDGWRGQIRFEQSNHHNTKSDTEIVKIEASRARKFWDIAIEDEPHLFALASGVLTHNSNPMPESVTDRPTKAHEYLFLLAKSERYWWDQEAIREPAAMANGENRKGSLGKGPMSEKTGLIAGFNHSGDGYVSNGSRNKRTVWSLSSQSFPGAHFAVMPEALVEPCLLAGCPAQVCAECGEPWVRVVERDVTLEKGRTTIGLGPKTLENPMTTNGDKSSTLHHTSSTKTIAHTPTCQCNGHFEEQMIPDYYDWEETAEAKKKVVRVYVPDISLSAHVTRPGVVLDPFFGSGTVGVVAKKFKREWAGIELNPDYAEMARKRLDQTQPALFAR